MQRLRIRGGLGTIVFCLLSMGLAWLLALPLWLGKGLADPKFLWIAVAIMFTPSISALIISILEGEFRNFAKKCGLWSAYSLRRFVVAMFLAILVPLFLVFQAPVVGSLLGVFPGDLTNFSMLHFLAGDLNLPSYILLQLGAVLVAGVLNLLPALGEEIGWRGWLWPRLQPLGQIPAILISGVVWGVWHSPLILLGYNYPFASGTSGVLYMCGMCIVVGAFFSWLRTLSNSVWPSALAHGIFNASAGLMIWFSMFGAVVDTRNASIFGWSGWIIPALLILVMAGIGCFKVHVKEVVSTTRSGPIL